MDFNKIRVVSFALRNRLLGYQLLENPKYKSPYFVKMVRRNNNISIQSLDVFDFKYVKSRDFSKKGTKTDIKLFQRIKYMFWPDKDNKDVVYTLNYLHYKSNGEFWGKYYAPEGIDAKVADRDKKFNPDTAYINTVYGTDGIRYGNDLLAPKTIADVEVDKFYEQRRIYQAKMNEKSFWTILRHNLRNK